MPERSLQLVGPIEYQLETVSVRPAAKHQEPAAARDVLRLVLWPPRAATSIARLLEPFLLREAVTPDASRAPLLARVESRTQYFYRATVGGCA